MENSTVTIPLSTYEDLRKKNEELQERVNQLSEDFIIKASADKDKKVAVFLKYIDFSGKETLIHEKFINATEIIDEIKDDTQKGYEKRISALEETNKQLCEHLKKQSSKKRLLADKILGLEIQLSNLKKRSLWQRIINKI